MEFSTKEDIEAPIEEVFDQVSDFEALERAAMQRGASVTRHGAGQPGVGTAWEVRFDFRGRTRNVRMEITEYDPPNRILCESVADGLEVRMTVELIAMSRSRTRMSLDAQLHPTTLSARLLVQSLKLARSKINRRIHLRVADYARHMEERLRRRA